MLARRRILLTSTFGILGRVIIKSVAKYEIPSLYVSLDGGRETYRRVRGVDTYDKVLNTIRECSKICSVTIGFTLTPYNGYRDFIHVAKIAKEYRCNLWINIFGYPPHFNIKKITEQEVVIRNEAYKMLPLLSDVDKLYFKIYLNNIALPCLSTRFYSTVLPNGDVLFCQGLSAVLGNIRNKAFKDMLHAFMS